MVGFGTGGKNESEFGYWVGSGFGFRLNSHHWLCYIHHIPEWVVERCGQSQTRRGVCSLRAFYKTFWRILLLLLLLIWFVCAGSKFRTDQSLGNYVVELIDLVLVFVPKFVTLGDLMGG